MREKVVPIPFLGKEVSGWMYRTTRWTRENPFKTAGILLLCVGGSILYEAQVTHKNRMPSPNVNNHLEYQLKQESLWERLWASKEAPKAIDAGGERQAPTDAEVRRMTELSRRAITDAERLLESTSDPKQREELTKVIEKERKLMDGVNDTTMLVRSGQLEVRAPHWEIRNNERNWSILSRDQQQQKDHYWYRLERSKEDDFSRNTYSRP